MKKKVSKGKKSDSGKEKREKKINIYIVPKTVT